MLYMRYLSLQLMSGPGSVIRNLAQTVFLFPLLFRNDIITRLCIYDGATNGSPVSGTYYLRMSLADQPGADGTASQTTFLVLGIFNSWISSTGDPGHLAAP